MNNLKFFHQALNLGDDWSVDEVSFSEDISTVHIHISYAGGELICPETGERGPVYDHRKLRKWRHRDLFEYKCYLHCRIPRIKSSAGVKSIRIPWASSSDRFTHGFACNAIDTLKSTKNQTETAKLLRCGFRLINRVMHRSVERGLGRRSIQTFKDVSMDEKAFKRGRKYATIVSDGRQGTVIDLAEGRDETSARALVERIIPEEIRTKVETVTLDMWRAYRNIVEKLFPEAKLIHDRFHLIKKINKAINRVRRREVKQHPQQLKNSRYALLKNPENRTQKQDEIFQTIQEANLQVGTAWQLRENFKAIFGCTSFSEAKTYFQLWLDSVKETGIKEVIDVAETFERHLTGVCNALSSTQSNARAERLNGKIQHVITTGRGYRNFGNFRTAVLFFHGNLSLYPQPSQ